MTLRKEHIVDNVEKWLKPFGFSRRKSVDTVEILIEIIKRTLEQGEDVMISGFGKFSVREKAARKGRNPATGEEMMLRARRVVTFRYSGKLRDKLNMTEEEKRRRRLI